MNEIIISGARGSVCVYEHDALARVLLRDGDFEPHFYQIAKNVVQKGDICVDAGANVGYHSITLSKLVGLPGLVVAIEPLAQINRQLVETLRINGCVNVHPLRGAVAEVSGELEMDPVDYPNCENIGATKVGKGGDRVIAYQLDQVLDRLVNSARLSFIKLDVQGSEPKALAGAAKVIKRAKPILFVEMEEVWLNFFGSSIAQLQAQIRAMGYMVVRICNDYPCDHVCIPNERLDDMPSIMKDLTCPIHVVD